MLGSDWNHCLISLGRRASCSNQCFIAAWKVDIQSDNYTFHFKHEKGDLGFGMVLPVWQDSDVVLPDPLTRITLHLHQNREEEEIEHLHQTIFKQLNDLEQTCLLFLRNLKEMRVSFFDGDGGLQSSKKVYLDNDSLGKVFLMTESIDENGNSSNERKGCYATRSWQLGFREVAIENFQTLLKRGFWGWNRARVSSDGR